MKPRDLIPLALVLGGLAILIGLTPADPSVGWALVAAAGVPVAARRRARRKHQ